MNDRAALLRFALDDAGLSALLSEVRGRMTRDPAHDLDHAIRVAIWTVRIAGEDVAPRLAVAAALLHDVVQVPKGSEERAAASERAARVVLESLPSFGFSADDVAAVADAVRDHSWSRGAVPRTPLGRALQDADRLEALGAVGILRCVATGVSMGSDLFDAADPFARARPLDDRAHSIDHFFVKLLRIPERMTTEIGRREAERRAAAMRAFLSALGEEIGEPPPEG